MEDFGNLRMGLMRNPNVRFKSYPYLNHLLQEGKGKSTPMEYSVYSPVPDYLITDIAAFINDKFEWFLNMPKKENPTKNFVLRIDAETMDALEKWAADEFRSTNGQLQWIIAEALKKNGRLKKKKKDIGIEWVLKQVWLISAWIKAAQGADCGYLRRWLRLLRLSDKSVL